jgi:hypothetical protein
MAVRMSTVLPLALSPNRLARHCSSALEHAGQHHRTSYEWRLLYCEGHTGAAIEVMRRRLRRDGMGSQHQRLRGSANKNGKRAHRDMVSRLSGTADATGGSWGFAASAALTDCTTLVGT